MSGTIFIEQLKREWRQILYWGIGLAFLPFLILSMAQEADFLEGYANLVEGLDKAVPGLFQSMGLESADSLRDPDGFVGFIMVYSILGMAVYGVTAGLKIIANDEDEGIMDVELALPVERWRIIIEKFLAFSVITAAIAIVSYAGVLGGWAVMVEELRREVSLGNLFAVTLNMIPATLTTIAVTTLIASVFSRKLIVTSLSGLFVMVSFVFFIVDDVATSAIAKLMGQLSIFTYFNSGHAAQYGVPPENALTLLVVAVILVGISTVTFQRRDVGI